MCCEIFKLSNENLFIHFFTLPSISMRKEVDISVRHKIVALREAKISSKAVASQLNLKNPPTTCTIYNLYLETGSVMPKFKNVNILQHTAFFLLCFESNNFVDEPLRVTSASMTASKGGGSSARPRNSRMVPSLSSFIDSAISCRGVRKISGVLCCCNLQKIE